ncbi:MAG: NAD(P)H-dependent oxidoreductase subunit E [Flammeovirgaceae bacterium]|nr:NAD(P)H-dependent oxidoreductase subunit E [Flammeovirgaceae bacterium]
MSTQLTNKKLFSVEPPRSLLLSQLWTLQKAERHISKSSIEKLAQQHRLSEIEIEGVASFYHFFHKQISRQAYDLSEQ